MNADNAGKELQGAYDRRFQLDLSSHIRSTAGDFQKGFQDNMYRLFNLSGRGSIEKIDQAEVKNDINELLIHLLDGDNLPSQWRLHTPLLEGENKTFLQSGRFHLRCTLDNAFTFKAIADSIRTTVRKHGTRAAASALMGRNLSHNIGAHALYWLEKEQGNPELARFNAYLRERMDFVAAISTYMPLWITSTKMGKIVKDIRENHLLLKNIAKSERVFGVEVDYQGEDCSVAIPGGILGIQAFNAILENIIRDGAKYGSRQSSEGKGSYQSIQFAVKVSELQESDFATTEEKVKTDLKRNFVKVVITDSQSSYADTKTIIQEALDDIEKNGLCDEKGQLLPNNWGIKERWISASFLRGEQVEEKLAAGRLGNKQEALRILDILDDNGQLGWVFYLMKPQEVLVIKDDATQLDVPIERRDKVIVENWNWLKAHVDSSYLRHRFIVLCPQKEEDVNWLNDNWIRLPYRILISSSDSNLLSQLHPLIPQVHRILDLQNLTINDVYDEWLNFLLRRPWKDDHQELPIPSVFFISGGWGSNEIGPIQIGNLTMERRLLLTDKDIQEGEKPKVIFDAHGSCADSLFPTERENDWRKLRGDVIHYEPHEAAHNVRELVDVPKIANLLTEGEEALKQRLSALVESALIRILIIDERIDPTLDNANVDFSPELSIKMRDFLQGKNIYVNGREYAGENIPDKNSLIDWVKRREVDIVFLHQGIVDKLHKKHQEQGERQSKNEYAKKLLDQLKKEGKLWDIVIHSARGGIPELPRDVKFLSLSSIDSWIARTYSKHDIIQELLGLRRTEGYEAHYTHK